MSFGTSGAVRFENDPGGRRPVVFWDKQAKAAENKVISKNQELRKRGQKGQKFPLRNNKQNQESSQPSNKPANRKPVHGQVIKPTNKRTERHYGNNKKKVPETAGTVVLTQKEFDAILDTIGQLAIEAERPLHTLPNHDPASTKASIDPGVSIELTPAHGVHNIGDTPRGGLAVAKDLPPSPVLAVAKELPPSPIPLQPSPQVGRAHHLDVPAQLSTQVTSQRPAVHTSMEKPLSELLTSVRGVPTAHMTKAERKRLEWEKERAEQQLVEKDWDPWGRPGAGAPIRDTGGQILTDYKTRASQPSTTPTVPVSTAFNRGRVNTTTPAMTVTSTANPPPAAIRSSIMIGEAEPNENRFESAKERQRKEWLLDLEKQREEQRQRRLSEKNTKQEGELYDKWADHFSTYKPSGLPVQQMAPPATQDPEASVGRVYSAPVAPPVVQTSPPHEDGQRSMIRGQNVPIDSKTVQEYEEKRRKHLEHQEFIRLQIEEKERLKRQEKEKQMKEEQLEDERLRRERESLQSQLQRERDRVKAKEEQERQRLDTLRQAMEEAQMVAEQEKHAKRVRKLQQAGHDTAQLHANFEAKMTPRAGAITSTSTVHAGPAYSPRNLDQSYPDQPPTQDMDQSYRGERVLTPTKFRPMGGSEPNSPRREFGIQTDPDVMLPLCQIVPSLSRESTDIVYKGPIERKKKVRVQSAPRQERVQRVQSAPNEPELPVTKRQLKIHERPQWGVSANKQKKKLVKQSEKDPFYDEKMRKREQQRVQRQTKLRQAAAIEAPLVSKKSTVASRARSRSGDRNEGHQRSRSRSPPRDNFQGRRSRRDSDGPRSRKHSQGHEDQSHTISRNSRRSTSPPVPALKHRHNNQDGLGTGRSDLPSHRHKYQDQGPVQAPVDNQTFIPFIRSSNVLDPAHAESPMPLSREPTMMDRARRAYIQERDPAKFGFQMDNLNDEMLRGTVAPQANAKPRRGVDPILHPEAVKDHPTQRQTQILQHLSDLRRGLMQKQRELEFEQQAVIVE